MSVFLDIQTENSKHVHLDCGQALCVTRSETSQIIHLCTALATRGYQSILERIQKEERNGLHYDTCLER